jgi:nicotinamidase-related amidase
MTDRDKTALVVVDMLNTYEHEDGDQLAENVKDAVPGIRSLLLRAADEGVPVIYVNDNYDDWNTSASELVEKALGGKHPELVTPIVPPESSDFVVKGRHTIFYGTPLEYLLYERQVGRLVLTGQVTEQCILYSALDAYVRHLEVAVPPDAVAHIDDGLGKAALEMMGRNMDADLSESGSCELRGAS